MTEGYIEKGFELTDSELEKINALTRKPFEADRLYTFSLVLCSNDIDRDYEKFSVDSLERLAKLFIGKTGIKDHSMKSSDQKARIFDAWVEKCDDRKTADGEDLYVLRAKAYMVRSEENLPLIEEIEAGIKKEVSISCSAGKSVCSVCGADKKKKHCGHIAGRSYDGAIAYRTLENIGDAYEFSFVAVPAQRDAGVTKSFDLTTEDRNMADIITRIKSCDKELVISKSQANELGAYIDALEAEAEIGRSCKKALAEEVVCLCASVLPEMDIKIFSGVAQVMTANELTAFKQAFSKKKSAKSVQLQLGADTCNENKFEQFKM